MKTQAAVVRATAQPFEVTTLELDAPAATEVQVKMIATGVCHTDAIVRDQIYPTFLPAVFCHEGAGIVEAVGSDIVSIKPGDRVVLGFNSCGRCAKCLAGAPAYCENFMSHNFACTRLDGSTAFSDNGEKVGSHFFGQSAFSQYTNVSGRSVVKIDGDVPLELLGPLGCGLSTGAGAILNSLDVKTGDTVVVLGTGAVGSAAIMAAAATGVTAVTRQAAESLAINGTVGLVGAPAPGSEVTFEVGASLVHGWKFRTFIEGDAIPQDFIPRLVHLWRQGKFPLEKLVRTYCLENINDAFADSKSGEVIKPIIVF